MFEYYENNEVNQNNNYRPDGFQMTFPIGGPPFGQGPGGQGPFGPPFGQGPGGQGPFGPPFGQGPGQGPFGPPFGQGPGGQGQFGPPSGPPPSITPAKSTALTLGGPSIYAIDPGAIRPCRFRYVFLWLNTGERFWAWLIFVGRRSVAGWRWTGFRWIYFGVDLNNIDSFYCYY